MRALAALLLASTLHAAEDPQPAADERYATGLDLYQSAVAADAVGRTEDARRLLTEARAALDAAIAGYRAVLDADPGRDAARRRLLAAVDVGRPCCGRRGLFAVYGVR